jgi:arylsulfate sulfotransferase
MTKSAPLQLFLVLILTIFTFSLGCGSTPQGVHQTQNPLVAEYDGSTSCAGAVRVEFGPTTSYGRSTAWYPSAGAGPTSILVAGMQASTTYHMRQQTQCNSGGGATGADLTFTTGALPSSVAFPTMTVTRPNPSATYPENPGIEMLTVTVENTPAFFTDRDGNPIWYYVVPQGYFPYTFKLLPNGHMIVSSTASITGTFDSTLQEIDLAGNLIREMDVGVLAQKMQEAGFDFAPTAYHHDLLPLANGHVVVLTYFAKDFTDLPGYPGTTAVVGDGLIDLDQNWNPVWAWNGFDYLDVNRHLNGLPDWTHSNGLVYSPDDGNILLSMRHQSWLLKIDYNNGAGSGNVIWKLGYQGDFALNVAGVPTDDPSQWFSFQHFPSFISQNGSETTLGIWDNGDNRVLNSSGAICGAASNVSCYSRGTVFQVDESTMTANLLWDDQQPLFGFWGGSINQLENGNIEFDLNDPTVPPAPNVYSQVQEVTQTSTPQVIWQMDIMAPWAAYRAYRVPSLYNGVAWQY